MRVWEREETKPARWAASWTESTKTSDFFSASSRVAWPNMLDSVTDIRVAMALPVKRMASVWPQLGQVSLAESSSASSPMWVTTRSTRPSRTAVGSTSLGVVVIRRSRGSNQASPVSGGASESTSAEALRRGRNRPSRVTWWRRMFSSLAASWSPTGPSSTPQPERPQNRQWMAGNAIPPPWVASSLATGGPSSAQRKRAAESA